MADGCNGSGLLSLEEATSLLRQHVRPVTDSLDIALEDCLGYTLAADVVSPLNVPPYNNSAMDGYAVRLSEVSNEKPLPIAGESFAGHPYQGSMPAGHCIRIMTGACIPAGADTVIMQEQATPTAEGVVFSQWPARVGGSIRQAGEDIQQGACVFQKGHKVRAQDVGLLASLGVATVSVFRRLKVAVFSTGDELRQPGETLDQGDIYDSNRFAIKAMLSKMNVDILDLGCIPDNKELIRKTVMVANEKADAVITSGGVSVGEADFTQAVLDEMGETAFWKLAIKPGKPFAFGQLSSSLFFGLPGNPVSALITFQQLAAPTLRAMMNAAPHPVKEFKAACRTALRKQSGRKEFQRGVWAYTEGEGVNVSTTGSQGSGILRSMSEADCYIVLPEDNSGVAVGDEVVVQLFDDLLL